MRFISYSLFVLCSCTLLSFASGSNLQAADSPSAQVEKAVASFEKALDAAFSSGRSTLDRFQKDHNKNASKLINTALNEATDSNDKLWLAWHLLFLNPKHHGAKKVFADNDQEVPLDLLGNFSPSEAPTAPSNKELVLLVHKNISPDNGEVIVAATPAVKRYSSKNRSATKTFYRNMENLKKKGFTGLVDPVMAYYFPKNANSSTSIQANKWISPPDRYLLEHGLLSAEVGFTKPRRGSVVRSSTHLSSQGTANFNFPIPLAHWRLEMILDTNSEGSGKINAWNSHISFSWGRDGSVSIDGNGISLEHKAADGTNSVQLVARGKQWSFIVNGALIKNGEMSYQAWESMDFDGGGVVQQLRLRYLNEHSSGLLAGVPSKVQAPKAKAKKPAAPEWEVALKAELKKTIEFNFEDTPVTEVVEGLNLISTVNWSLDESAMALADLPMFMVSEGMTGDQVLNWFERLAGLSYRLEESGVVLVWK